MPPYRRYTTRYHQTISESRFREIVHSRYLVGAGNGIADRGAGLRTLRIEPEEPGGERSEHSNGSPEEPEEPEEPGHELLRVMICIVPNK